MERRNLLMLMGLGVAVPWPVAENLRTALTRTAGATDSVADWRATVSDYASLYDATPPAQILPDLLSDLNEVNALLEAGHPEQAPLLEVAAALTTFTAMATYDAGHPTRAFRWWRTAQQLADRSGYAPIRAYVRARRGSRLVLHDRGQTAQALQLADEAMGIAKETRSRGLTEAHCLRTEALSVEGDPGARSAFDDFSRAAEGMGDRPYYAAPFNTSLRIQDTRTRTYARLGNGAAAVSAGRTHPHPDTQMFVAMGMVLAGKVEDGLGHATTTLTQLDPSHDRLSVRRKGGDV